MHETLVMLVLSVPPFGVDAVESEVRLPVPKATQMSADEIRSKNAPTRIAITSLSAVRTLIVLNPCSSACNKCTGRHCPPYRAYWHHCAYWWHYPPKVLKICTDLGVGGSEGKTAWNL